MPAQGVSTFSAGLSSARPSASTRVARRKKSKGMRMALNSMAKPPPFARVSSPPSYVTSSGKRTRVAGSTSVRVLPGCEPRADHPGDRVSRAVPLDEPNQVVDRVEADLVVARQDGRQRHGDARYLPDARRIPG